MGRGFRQSPCPPQRNNARGQIRDLDQEDPSGTTVQTIEDEKQERVPILK